MTNTPHPDRRIDWHQDRRHNQFQDRGGLAGYRYRQAGPVSLYLGDAREVLAAMPDASVDVVVTSPPFWGLRDYGTGRWDGGDPACPHPAPQPRDGDSDRDGDQGRCSRCAAVWTDPQYGLEPTVEEYVARLVAVFDEVRRVLAPTGTAWLNLGDSYSSATTGSPKRGRQQPRGAPVPQPRTQLLPPKNLIGVPWRAAFALQRSGWILRNAVVL